MSDSFGQRRRAVRLFRGTDVPKALQRHNQRAWLRAVKSLGDRWICAPAQHIMKKEVVQ